MNEHEIDRIAAAVNALRPDWPIASLRTLMQRPELARRPRRDVAVALTWVACDSTTATPARVIEAGPWWRAAAVEGGATAPRTASDEWCSTCNHVERICRQLYTDDHPFLPVRKTRPGGYGVDDTTPVRQALHAARATVCHHGIPHNVCRDRHDTPKGVTP